MNEDFVGRADQPRGCRRYGGSEVVLQEERVKCTERSDAFERGMRRIM